MPDEGLPTNTPPPGTSNTAESLNVGKEMAQGVSGFEMVASGVIFSLIGVWVDRRLGTTPIFILVLATLGFGGSMANVYYRYRREMEFHDAEYRRRRGGS